MIKTQVEYAAMKSRLVEEEALLERQRQTLVDAGLTNAQLEAAMEPLLDFYEQLKEEIGFYERVMRKDFSALSDFESVGRLLIALRIAQNMSQAELAAKLGVSPSVVSRDEKDEYHGASKEKIARVARALGYRLSHVEVVPIADDEPGLLGAALQ